MIIPASALYLLCFATAGVAADPVDWVDINYVVRQGKSNGGATTSAQSSIASKAGSTSQQGPWTIQTKGINPPSGDPRDYLSWAPYHWPHCHWCSKGSTHYINSNDTYNQPADGAGGTDPEDGPPDDSSNYLDGDSDDSNYSHDQDDADGVSATPQNVPEVEDLKNEIAAINFAVRPSPKRDLLLSSAEISRLKHHTKRVHRFTEISRRGSTVVHRRQDLESSQSSCSSPPANTELGEIASVAGVPSIPTALPYPGFPHLTTQLPTTSTSNRVAGTQAPAEAPAKTRKESSKCTPSPTKNLAPSATWTTCPYVVRDGKVNPDTDSLRGPDAAQDMSKSVIYNAISYTLEKTSISSKNVANAIDAFFLSSTTGMHPNVNFGQLVRGPGKAHQVGTFTGVLDLRGMVKVSNAIQLVRASKAPDWTSARDSSMTDWMKSYISWLQTSDIGKSVASKANNHLTFYVAQVTAVKIALGDTKGAADAVQKYFSSQFLDQIAQSGEQPFESVRTRPYHYRCFNLEAMITNAKMGDQLGLNLWIAKSKYGATIQTALDYTMSLDPKGEDISDIFPHVAAVAAAYGDPKGKYAAFLQKNNPNYKSQPFWFFDQSAALPHSPAGKTKRSDSLEGGISTYSFATSSSSHTADELLFRRDSPTLQSAATSDASSSFDNSTAPAYAAQATIPFECPAVFKDATTTELEDGLFVTCDELKPFYEIPLLVDSDTVY